MYPIGGFEGDDDPENVGPPHGGARFPGPRLPGQAIGPAGPGAGPRRGRRTGPVRAQHDGGDGSRPGRFDHPDSGSGAGGGRAGAGPTPPPPAPAPAGRRGTAPTGGRGTTEDPGPARPDPGPDVAHPEEQAPEDGPTAALPADLVAGGLLDGLLGARADPAPEDTVDPANGRSVEAAAPANGRRSAHSRDDALIDDLARRAATGDRAALHELLRLVDPLVVRYCRAHLGGNRIGLAGPDDVAQEVMVAVCKALPSFDRSRSVFMAFVYGIAGNKIADAFRAAARDRSVSTDELPEGVDLAGGPEAEALRDDAARQIAKLLARLPESARLILVHRLALNYSAEETAALVGMTPGAVRVAQHRALQKLREWIAKGEF
ncbi:MAG: RNA polymerase sigma factor ShbA [Pseudonocardia sp.]|uniref:RNA polymerase sigma factor ShbA n=1 Tax=Pseudonocardia sp. TaxID=60912 RepID=UPI003D0E5B4E